MKKFLDELAKMDDTNTFDADHYAEWFMEGTLTDSSIASLTCEQMDEVAKNLLVRWGEEEAAAWDEKALPLLKI